MTFSTKQKKSLSRRARAREKPNGTPPSRSGVPLMDVSTIVSMDMARANPKSHSLTYEIIGHHLDIYVYISPNVSWPRNISLKQRDLPSRIHFPRKYPHTHTQVSQNAIPLRRFKRRRLLDLRAFTLERVFESFHRDKGSRKVQSRFSNLGGPERHDAQKGPGTCASVGAQEHVLRFEVSVNDTLRVQVVQRSHQLPRDVAHLFFLRFFFFLPAKSCCCWCCWGTWQQMPFSPPFFFHLVFSCQRAAFAAPFRRATCLRFEF